MRLSSREGPKPGLERAPVAQHRPQHADAASGERDQDLVVALALPALPPVEGSAGGRVQRAEGGLVEDLFEGPVAAVGAPDSGLRKD